MTDLGGQGNLYELVMLVLLMLERCVSIFRSSRRSSNGVRAHVDPSDAQWFKVQQVSILRGVNRGLRHQGLEEEPEQD